MCEVGVYSAGVGRGECWGCVVVVDLEVEEGVKGGEEGFGGGLCQFGVLFLVGMSAMYFRVGSDRYSRRGGRAITFSWRMC